MRNRQRYGKDWKKRSRAAKEKAGWMCSVCQAKHGSDRYSHWLDKMVKVYLQAHHLSYEPEILVVVCPRCHWHHYHKKICGNKLPSWLLRAMKQRKLVVIVPA